MVKKISNTQCHSDNAEISPNGKNIREIENENFALPPPSILLFPLVRKKKKTIFNYGKGCT